MTNRIEDLLQRRTDLSTFLVHLTKDYDGHTAIDNLKRILDRISIEARSVFGMGRDFATGDQHFQESQKVVCFTETPLEHVWMMCSAIEGREHGLSPYGVAVTKAWARRNRVNPVWYLDITPGHTWLTNPINSLRQLANDDAVATGQSLADYDIARLLPFIEQMGPMTNGGRKEFWWEREWRHVDHIQLPWPHIVAVFAPEADHRALRRFMIDTSAANYDKPPLLDPQWGLERMIGQLRGIHPDDAGPIPRY